MLIFFCIGGINVYFYKKRSGMKFGTAHLKIRVYSNDHPPPHCHLLRKNGNETRIAIPSLLILTGPKLSREEEDLILNCLDELCFEFDKLNPAIH
jgi:hypothetical protein